MLRRGRGNRKGGKAKNHPNENGHDEKKVKGKFSCMRLVRNRMRRKTDSASATSASLVLAIFSLVALCCCVGGVWRHARTGSTPQKLHRPKSLDVTETKSEQAVQQRRLLRSSNRTIRTNNGEEFPTWLKMNDDSPPRKGGEKKKGPSTEKLEHCLSGAVHHVVFPSSPDYSAARQCRNLRADIQAWPLAIVRVSGTLEVAAAVRCAAGHLVKVCARSGRHGFENSGCCDGGVVVDVADLVDFEVVGPDERGGTAVRFGAGHTNGQLYSKLVEGYSLVVPGGTEATVGTSGLFLGCGRGLLTQTHGLSCDKILAVEFVDVSGKLRVANETSNQDMYWLARGGGGFFPGVVTSFTVAAVPAPQSVHKRKCSWQYSDSSTTVRVILEWEKHLEALSDSRRSMFSHISLFGPPNDHAEFETFCFDCDPDQLAWMDNAIDAITSRRQISPQKPMVQCKTVANGIGWLETLLQEPGSVRLKDGLTQRDAWWLPRQAESAAQLDSTYNRNQWINPSTRDMIEALVNWTFTSHQTLTSTKQSNFGNEMILLFPIGGDAVDRTPPSDTAYGNREGKWTFHIKHLWPAKGPPKLIDEYERAQRSRHAEIGRIAGTGICSGFLNYWDRRMPCAVGKKEGLQVKDDLYGPPHEFFGKKNAERVERILVEEDPSNIFGAKWGGEPHRIVYGDAIKFPF